MKMSRYYETIRKKLTKLIGYPHITDLLLEKPRALLMLLALGLLASGLEFLTIGGLFYFMDTLSEIGDRYPKEIHLSGLLLSQSQQMALISTIFIIFVITSIAFRAWYLKFASGYSHRLGAELSRRIFLKILNMQNAIHSKSFENEIRSAISVKVNQFIYQFLIPLLATFISGATTIFISIFIALKFPKLALLGIAVILLSYLLIGRSSRAKMREAANDVRNAQLGVMEKVEDAFGFKTIITVRGSADKLTTSFEKFEHRFRKAQQTIFEISSLPRIFIEGFVIIVAAILLYSLFAFKPADPIQAITEVSVLIVATLKLLPQLNAVYSNFTILRGVNKVVKDLENILGFSDVQEKLDIIDRDGNWHKLNFNVKINKNATKTKVDNFKFTIKKGEKILISGQSGVGKTSFCYSLMGLDPSSKTTVMMGRKKTLVSLISKSLFSFTEQKPYIQNSNVDTNITLSDVFEDKIDLIRLGHIKEQLGINSSLNAQQLSEDFKVGSDRRALSGGQMQRIAIARAIYSQKPVLIFDESTNALDIEGEIEMISIISKLDATVIYVSHSPIIRKFFDKELNINEENIVLLELN